ncbi:MAG: arginine--tRNA ligase, partial [bacterium]|nr:arginine--tRNA ligase [bacterium]
MFRSRLEPVIMQAIVELQRERMLPPFDVPPFSVNAPENASHGDYATNAALIIAKVVGRTPMEIAELIASRLRSYDAEIMARVEAVAPGFVNITLSDQLLSGSLGHIISEPAWWRTDRERGKKVIAEFTDPNPFKEFHIGHLYSNVVGEALSRIFEAGGAEVKRANYQGDVGLHVAKAVWGMRRNLEAAAMALVDLEGQDPDERVKFLGHAYTDGARAFEEDERAKGEIIAINKKIFASDPDIAELYETGRRWSLEYFERIYRRLGTKFDFYYFERDVGRIGRELVREHLTKGVFEESDGAVIFPGEKY